MPGPPTGLASPGLGLVLANLALGLRGLGLGLEDPDPCLDLGHPDPWAPDLDLGRRAHPGPERGLDPGLGRRGRARRGLGLDRPERPGLEHPAPGSRARLGLSSPARSWETTSGEQKTQSLHNKEFVVKVGLRVAALHGQHRNQQKMRSVLYGLHEQ